MKTKQINQILSMIEPERKTRWDKDYIEQLYIGYQNRGVNDRESIEKLRTVCKGKRFYYLLLEVVSRMLRMPFEN